jgi:hypothetical protein
LEGAAAVSELSKQWADVLLDEFICRAEVLSARYRKRGDSVGDEYWAAYAEQLRMLRYADPEYHAGG